VEQLRTWIIEHNFQIPPLFVEEDELEEKRRRAGVPRRRKKGGKLDGEACHENGRLPREAK
jgi:hypothetical protein